jgi:hypothetical protein
VILAVGLGTVEVPAAGHEVTAGPLLKGAVGPWVLFG